MSAAPTITISPRAVVAALVALTMMLGLSAMAPAPGGPLLLGSAMAQDGNSSRPSSPSSSQRDAARGGGSTSSSATDVGNRLGQDLAGGVKGLIYALVAAVFVIAIVRREVAGAMVAAGLGLLALMILNPDFMNALSGGLTDSVLGR